MPNDSGFSVVIMPAEFSEESLALSFTRQHGHNLRYVAGWGRWMQWTGCVWEQDGTLRVFDLAREICRAASAEAKSASLARAVSSAKTVAAVERLAKADRQHAATVDQWDSNPWLLNTPGGIVDLQTGLIGTHDSDALMTKITAVAPGGDCPQWDAFLQEVMQGDGELIAYLQRMAGYILTGSIQEHALFFAYGTGANGKSVMLNTLTGIMGNYAEVAPMDTFTASASDRHPTDLAMLRGARIVTAQETEEGRRWAEAKIKALTGGDRITARFMRQNFFTFEPTFKLLIAGNHRPCLRNVDEAIRRRFNLLPFLVRISSEARDPLLPEKLKAEWPGILAWAIRGCLDWQHGGLRPPAAVRDATAEYLEAEDALAAWLGECCIIAKGLEVGSTPLFNSWKAWCERSGETPASQRRLSQNLKTRGLESARLPTGEASFRGIGLNALA